MKSYLFVLGHTLTLAAMIVLEAKPNKYLENVFVLFRTWAALQATVFFATWMTFKSKLPSPSTINWALEITRPARRTWAQRFLYLMYRTQPVLVCLAALLFGQWFILITYALFLFLVGKIRPAAQEYLRGMHIDLEKKSAVIDV